MIAVHAFAAVRQLTADEIGEQARELALLGLLEDEDAQTLRIACGLAGHKYEGPICTRCLRVAPPLTGEGPLWRATYAAR